MSPKKIIRPSFNPALEILPLMLSMVVDYFMPYNIAFWAGVILFAIWLTISTRFFRSSPPFMLVVTGAIFLIYASGSLIKPFRELYSEYSAIICEILLAVTFIFLGAFKRSIKEKCKNTEADKVTRNIRKAKLNEFFYVAGLYKNILIFHLFVVLIYDLLPDTYHSPGTDSFIYLILCVLLIVFIIIYESIRLSLLKKQIGQEEWLPIVNETGGVTGRIALSVSQVSKKQFLHPVIRIALIYKGRLYLKERPANYISDPNKIDYPFEKYVFYKHTLEDAVKNCLQKGSGVNDLPVRFVFRYLFKNQVTHRLIYLYTCNIHDEETMNKLRLETGRLWTDKQIEENINKGVFSECFEKEYEILKNTVLMASKLIKNTESTSTQKD